MSAPHEDRISGWAVPCPVRNVRPQPDHVASRPGPLGLDFRRASIRQRAPNTPTLPAFICGDARGTNRCLDSPREQLALPNIIASDSGALRALNVARFGRHAASLRLAWSTTLFEGAREFDIIQCHFGALGLKAVLLRAAGALKGKIVTAFHGEDITNYPQQFSGNIYAPLFASGDLFLPISARWNDTLAALGCPSGENSSSSNGCGLPPLRHADAARLIRRSASHRHGRASGRKEGGC